MWMRHLTVKLSQGWKSPFLITRSIFRHLRDSQYSEQWNHQLDQQHYLLCIHEADFHSARSPRHENGFNNRMAQMRRAISRPQSATQTSIDRRNMLMIKVDGIYRTQSLFGRAADQAASSPRPPRASRTPTTPSYFTATPFHLFSLEPTQENEVLGSPRRRSLAL